MISAMVCSLCVFSKRCERSSFEKCNTQRVQNNTETPGNQAHWFPGVSASAMHIAPLHFYLKALHRLYIWPGAARRSAFACGSGSLLGKIAFLCGALEDVVG